MVYEDGTDTSGDEGDDYQSGRSNSSADDALAEQTLEGTIRATTAIFAQGLDERGMNFGFELDGSVNPSSASASVGTSSGGGSITDDVVPTRASLVYISDDACRAVYSQPIFGGGAAKQPVVCGRDNCAKHQRKNLTEPDKMATPGHYYPAMGKDGPTLQGLFERGFFSEDEVRMQEQREDEGFEAFQNRGLAGHASAAFAEAHARPATDTKVPPERRAGSSRNVAAPGSAPVSRLPKTLAFTSPVARAATRPRRLSSSMAAGASKPLPPPNLDVKPAAQPTGSMVLRSRTSALPVQQPSSSARPSSNRQPTGRSIPARQPAGTNTGSSRPAVPPRQPAPQAPPVPAHPRQRPIKTFYSGLQWAKDVTKRMIMTWADADPIINNESLQYVMLKRFDTKAEGEAWVNEFKGVAPPAVASNTPSAPTGGSHSSGSSSDSTATRRRRRRRRKRKAHPKASHRQHRRSRDSSDSSAEEEPTRESRRESQGNSKASLRCNVDASVGDNTSVYGVPIVDQEIDKFLGPDDASTKEMEALFNAAPDVTSLAGTFYDPKISQSDDPIDMATRLVTAFTNTTLSSRAPRISEPTYKSPSKNVMARVTNEEEFHEYAASIAKCEEPVFDSMDTVVTEFMLLVHFSMDAIRDYLYGYGLLPKISRDTFRFFRALILRVQTLVHATDTRGTGWHESLAQQMFDHHAEKLYELRSYASSRKKLLLKTYIYLREAYKLDFYCMKLSEKQSVSYSKAAFAMSAGTHLKSSDGKCAHCHSADLHIMFGKDHNANVCPVKCLPFKADARAAKNEILVNLSADVKLNKNKVLADAIKAHKS